MGTYLELNAISKSFGPTQALDSVSFSVNQGMIHGLIGENGAGKSTLIKILSGLLQPDFGTIMIQGVPYNLTPPSARKLGIVTAFQELSILPNLSVAENLALPFLRKSRSFSLSSSKDIARAASALLEEYNVPIARVDVAAGQFPLAVRQKLEIIRAFSQNPQLLLLDEPTAALPDPQWLYQVIETHKRPDLTIIYISHRLDEIRDLCESVTVLRNGQVVSTVESMARISNADIFRLMIGGRQIDTEAKEVRLIGDKPGIVVEGLSGEIMQNVGFTLRQGEILGVAALEGQGQLELFRVLAGTQRAKSGRINVNGRSVQIKSPRHSFKHGIGFIPEERKTEGILGGMQTTANISVSSLHKVTQLGFMMRSKEAALSATFGAQTQLDLGYLVRDINDLSGGNQQKALLARILASGAKFILAYDPTRGVDVGTKAIFYSIALNFTKAGGSVLWYSTEIPELVEICDRCLVFYRGRITETLSAQDLSGPNLIRAITGQQKEVVNS